MNEQKHIQRIPQVDDLIVAFPTINRGTTVLIAAHAALLFWLLLVRVEVPALRSYYLPLHTSMEIFSVVIAAMIFAIGWHSFEGKTPRTVVILSAAFFAVALLDLGHLMSVKGMPTFVTPASMSKAIAFWLAARGVSAAALLAAAILNREKRPVSCSRLLAMGIASVFVTLVYWIVLFRPEVIPETFIEGQGLTPFKIWTEYLLVASYLVAALLFLRRTFMQQGHNANLLVAAAVMAMSELCFTLYADAADLFNIVGHVYKVVAYIFLYRAIFVAGVNEPYRRLHRSEQSLTESESKYRNLTHQLAHDSLTGLPNRSRIIEKLHEAIRDARTEGTILAVLFVDIDFFKKINDSFGHNHGDEVLRECVLRLSRSLRQGDTLARHGGDEFIVLQQNVAHPNEASVFAEALLHKMRAPFHIRGHEVFLSASIGITLFPNDEMTEEGLLHKANLAMNSAKNGGRNCHRFYTPDMDQVILERLEMESYLRSAVEKNELLLHYQPRANLANGAIVGAEALLRWNHPLLGVVPPSRFIPIAEESGLIEPIGMWVLREACTQTSQWVAEGLPPMRVSINLSARQFQKAGLAQRVRSVLDEVGLDPAWIELELTESTVMHDTQAAVAALHSLKELGVALSIDDFGTGYSSLNYLKLFPIDVLKIDRSFIKDVVHNSNDAAIARAIIALGHSLDLSIVAEGVETPEQMHFLLANGCDEVQGYYISRPLPPEALAELLRERRAVAMPGAAAGAPAQLV